MLGQTIQQGQGGVAITPSDSVNQGAFRGLYVGGVGNVTLVGLDGATVLLTAVPAGTYLPIGFVRINATATTATLMVGVT